MTVAVVAGWPLLARAESPRAEPAGKTTSVEPARQLRFFSAPLPPPGLIGATGMMMVPPHMNVLMGPGAQVDGPVVAGKPYAAVATTEHIQVLVDGNRIVNTMRAVQYRDALGRTRYEQLASGGPGQEALTTDEPVTVRISDPAKGESWLLVPKDRMALRLPRLEMLSATDGPEASAIVLAEPGSAPFELPVGPDTHPVDGVLPFSNFPENRLNRTPLGDRRIEGLETRGERTEHTIPANVMGNEQPIARTTEQWRSESIEAVVLMTINDPLGGNVTYSLTDIRTTEMPAELFEVPADYQRVDDVMRGIE